jgi:hypothetical protein
MWASPTSQSFVEFLPRNLAKKQRIQAVQSIRRIRL